LGNAKTTDAIKQGLQAALPDASAVVREHIQWALVQHE
jgi:epoxyqueuosine reductase QueG